VKPFGGSLDVKESCADADADADAEGVTNILCALPRGNTVTRRDDSTRRTHRVVLVVVVVVVVVNNTDAMNQSIDQSINQSERVRASL
jgi:hypothetical protein